MIKEAGTAEAAKMLGVHPVTLRKWRAKSSIHGKYKEDCQGLMWRLDSTRRVMYDINSVNNLKRLIEKRKLR